MQEHILILVFFSSLCANKTTPVSISSYGNPAEVPKDRFSPCFCDKDKHNVQETLQRVAPDPKQSRVFRTFWRTTVLQDCAM